MQEPSRLQISDLETLATDALQEITPEEADKIVGGKQYITNLQLCPEDPIEMPPIKPPNKEELKALM